MQTTDETFTGTEPASGIPAMSFATLAAMMLATPLILFAAGCAVDSPFIIDGAGALFGIDVVLLMWLRDQRSTAPAQQKTHALGAHTQMKR